ncbi:MAG: hypothetical protein E6J21_02140 [Chloroflexota bacterium]|nr:MAG: hypothetical protein E6J21_02140 [Chloroflexota bacterium]
MPACLSSTASRCAPGSLSPGLSPVARFDGSASSYEPAQIAVSITAIPPGRRPFHPRRQSQPAVAASITCLPGRMHGCLLDP